MTKFDYYFYDGNGMKSVTLDGDEGWVIHGENAPATTLETYVNRLGWLRRAVGLVADTAKGVPFAITVKGKDFDTSDAWENKLGFLPNPRRLIEQISRSMIVYGNGYAFPNVNPANYVKSVDYWIPSSVEILRDTKTNRVTGFKRNKQDYQLESVIHFWPASEQVEDGPNPSSAALSALFAAGALYNMGEFVARYFDSGAVKVTLLAVKTNDKNEAVKIGDWWRKFVSGKNNAFQNRVINADMVDPKVIGDGLNDLENSELSRSSVEAISGALGVPQSMLMSNAANYATARVDQYNLYNTTVIPICERIADVLNEQLFTKQFKMDGYKIEFRAESLDAFHEDELTRAGAYSSYVNAKIKPSIAAQIVGIELPNGVEYADLDPEPTPEPPPPMVVNNNAPRVQSDPEDAEELRRWMRKSINALERGKSPAVEFVSDKITAAKKAEITARLGECKTRDEIMAAFDSEPQDDRIAVELKRANDMLAEVLSV